jgi:SAM-dependent methyltransferase
LTFRAILILSNANEKSAFWIANSARPSQVVVEQRQGNCRARSDPHEPPLAKYTGSTMSSIEVASPPTDNQAAHTDETFQSYLSRYRAGEWRDRIFLDMILADAARFEGQPTILDIGCGHGFDGNVALQQEVADAAGQFIGIEPDPTIQPGDYFHRIHTNYFEDAPLESNSIDLAYAVMVLEHLKRPQLFWDKLRDVLRPGGIFWGLTVDRRHWFCALSKSLDQLRLKELYLNLLLGKRGEKRYENYPVYYRNNAPTDIAKMTSSFTRQDCWNFSREGQCAAYFPHLFVPWIAWLDRRAIRTNRPGTLLAIRVQK